MTEQRHNVPSLSDVDQLWMHIANTNELALSFANSLSPSPALMFMFYVYAQSYHDAARGAKMLLTDDAANANDDDRDL